MLGHFAIYYGSPALSQFRLERLHREIRATVPTLEAIAAHTLYLVWAQTALQAPALARLEQVLALAPSIPDDDALQLFVTPRRGTLSPWSTKATEIAHNSGLADVIRIEHGTKWTFAGVDENAARLLSPHIHDRMTQSVWRSEAELERLANEQAPRQLQTIALSDQGMQALVAANEVLGLALNAAEISYLSDRYAELERDPTDIELMMFAQANSEHCRHKIFNAQWTVNGDQKASSLFAMIRETHATNPGAVLSAYSDNAAVVRGYVGDRFMVAATDQTYGNQREEIHLLAKVETHNHPTAISPFPGAATGAGGEIRDEGATGTGGTPLAGLTGFSVSHLRIPDHPEPWEQTRALNPRLASAFEIMQAAPIGAAAFNNEFGRPALAGYFRSFEMCVSGHAGDAWRGYDKPIMLAGGIGNVRPAHVHKQRLPDDAVIVVLGGPAMLLGLGGGAASSLSAGASDIELDFASVQRGNPEMQRRCQQVIDQCIALGDTNPILSIHDVGAGGLSNAIPELLADSERGGDIDLRAIPSADPAMSPLEIWCNEAQERYVLGIAASDQTRLLAVCEKERCPVAVVGRARAKRHLRVHDPRTDESVIDLPMDVLFGATPRLQRTANAIPLSLPPSISRPHDLEEAALSVLRHPSVGDKGFLITIADRNVGGLSVRDQMVGPWQVPVADCAIAASDYYGRTGVAMAIGERTPLALANAAAAARLAVGEALTNIAAARVLNIADVSLSANWMVAADHPGEGARLYEAVSAVSELCQALGICIPVGKDSMSMSTRWEDPAGARHEVTAPLSLIVSAFAPVADTAQALSPQIDARENATVLLFVDLASGQQRLGGSIYAQTQAAFDSSVPDCDHSAELREFFGCLQLLNDAGYILAYHDRSDGGLLACICEMAFAGRVGVEINLDALGRDPRTSLFNEELGVIMQIEASDLAAVRDQFEKMSTLNPHVHVVGHPTVTHTISIRHQGAVVLDLDYRAALQAWTHCSHAMKRYRDNPACADEEHAAMLNLSARGLYLQAPAMVKGAPCVNTGCRPRIAILREQGVNGHREMAAAFDRAGFAAVDVHMSQLIAATVDLANFAGLAACGGFSYGDVLGAGSGWAKSILLHPPTATMFASFFARPDTFTLGVCNGCQMLSQLADLIPGADHWPRFLANRSEQFEARLVMARVVASPSILLTDLADMHAPIVVAHGEGRAEFAHSQQLVCLRYVDDNGTATERYPANPNGSPDGITGLTTTDGRVTIMMPHPERVFLKRQFSWIDPSWSGPEGPWMAMFHNARRFLA